MDKNNTVEKGILGEQEAERYLLGSELHLSRTVLARNVRYKFGEIDRVFLETSQSGEVTLVFVEIKWREIQGAYSHPSSFYEPSVLFRPQKSRRLIKAIRHFLAFDLKKWGDPLIKKATQIRVDLLIGIERARGSQKKPVEGDKIEWTHIQNVIQ